MNKDVLEQLEKLKNSKIVDSQLFYEKLNNLCEATYIITDDIFGDVERLENVRKNKTEIPEYLIDNLQKKLFSIGTLVKTIQEDLMNNDFTELDNLFYSYNKASNSNKVLI